MKKFLKSLLIAIMLVPLSLSLVACGGDQLDAKADVDTKGKYSEVTMADVKAYTSEVKESDAFNKGVKVTMSLSSASGGDAESAGTGEIFNMEVNSVLRWTKKTTDDGDIEFTINDFAYRANANIKNEKQVVELYYKDGVQYTNIAYGENKVQHQKEAEIETVKSSAEYLSYIESIVDKVDFAEFIEDIEGDLKNGSKVKVEKATSGKYTKWHINVTAPESLTSAMFDGSVDVYYVFKSNKLVGMTLEMDMGILKISATMEAFDDEIKLPKDAKDYPTTIPSADVLEKFEGLEDLFD